MKETEQANFTEERIVGKKTLIPRKKQRVGKIYHTKKERLTNTTKRNGNNYSKNDS